MKIMHLVQKCRNGTLKVIRAITVPAECILAPSSDRNEHGFPLVDEPVNYSPVTGRYQRQSLGPSEFSTLTSIIDPVHRYRICECFGGTYCLFDRATQQHGRERYSLGEVTDLHAWLIERGLNYFPPSRPELH